MSGMLLKPVVHTQISAKASKNCFEEVFSKFASLNIADRQANRQATKVQDKSLGKLSKFEQKGQYLRISNLGHINILRFQMCVCVCVTKVGSLRGRTIVVTRVGLRATQNPQTREPWMPNCVIMRSTNRKDFPVCGLLSMPTG